MRNQVWELGRNGFRFPSPFPRVLFSSTFALLFFHSYILTDWKKPDESPDLQDCIQLKEGEGRGKAFLWSCLCFIQKNGELHKILAVSPLVLSEIVVLQEQLDICLRISRYWITCRLFSFVCFMTMIIILKRQRLLKKTVNHLITSQQCVTN